MAFYSIQKRPFYVMVQRGFPRQVSACGRSRADLEKGILWLEIHRKYGARFRDYAKSLQALVTGRRVPKYKPRFREARVEKSDAE